MHSFEILNIIPGIPPELLKFSPERLFKSFFGEILQLCFRKLLSGFLILFFKGFVKIIFPMLLKDFVTEFLSEISQGRVLYHLSRTFFLRIRSRVSSMNYFKNPWKTTAGVYNRILADVIPGAHLGFSKYPLKDFI